MLKKFPLISFFILTFGIFWTLLFLFFKYPIFGIFASWAPAFSAMIVLAATEGLSSVGALFRKLLIWRVGIRWYLAATLLPIAGGLLAVLIHIALGGPVPRIKPSAQVSLSTFIISFFVLGIWNLGEELGWRGFALPRLQSHMNALTASVTLGIIWSLWHLPILLKPGWPGYELGFFWFMGMVIGITVLMTWIFNGTQGSVLLTLLVHWIGMGPAQVLAMPFVTGQQRPWHIGVLISLILALIVIYWNGPRCLGSKSVVEGPKADWGSH